MMTFNEALETALNESKSKITSKQVINHDRFKNSSEVTIELDIKGKKVIVPIGGASVNNAESLIQRSKGIIKKELKLANDTELDYTEKSGVYTFTIVE